MQLLFIYQQDRIAQLGGLAVLNERAEKRFGTPTTERENAVIWSFPEIDRRVGVTWNDDSWTLWVECLSVSKQLRRIKAQHTVRKSTPPGLHVTHEQYGDKWPFTIPEGFVESIDKAIVFHTKDGKTYALNGIAIGKNRYLDIEPIWRPHPVYEGMKISVGPIIDAGIRTRTNGQKTAYSENSEQRPKRGDTRTSQSVSRKKLVAKLAEKRSRNRPEVSCPQHVRLPVSRRPTTPPQSDT